MGLDMILEKTKRIEKFKDNISIYCHVENSLEYLEWLKSWEGDDNDFIPFKDFFNTEKELASKEDMMLLEKQYISHCKDLSGPGSKSIWEYLHSWENAHQIHNWFVKNVQNDINDHNRYIVKKEQLEELLNICQQIIEHNFDPKIAKKLLSAKEDFFFKSILHQYKYEADIEEAVDILRKIIDTTDFEKEIVTYQSSW